MRRADVMARVTGSGVYSVSAIPALISNPSSQLSDTNHAGWTLAVVYEDSSQPLRSLTLWCGASAVSLDAGSTDISVAGFLTPDSLPISGKLFVSAQEGDAVIGGDSLLFGANAGALQVLSGPDNPADNFFASQIQQFVGTARHERHFRHAQRKRRGACGGGSGACRRVCDVSGRRRHNNTIKRF